MTVGLRREPIQGEAGLTCLPDVSIEEINLDEIDSLLLTGCMDIFALENEHLLFDWLKQADLRASVIASISSSPYLLARAGLLQGKRYTVGLSEQDRDLAGVFEKSNFRQDLVVQDGKLITARGRGFIPFGILFGQALQLSFDKGWYDHSIFHQ